MLLGRKDEKLPYSLKDIIDTKGWQKLQDNFSAVTNVGVRTISSEGNFIIIPSGLPSLCKAFFKNPALKEKICGNCLPTFLGGKEVLNNNLSFTCAAGLHNFLAPLRIDNKIFGYVIIGPVILIMRHPKESYRKIADDLGISLDDFWGYLAELKVVTFQGAESLIELIKDIAEYVLKIAYQNIKESGSLIQDSPKLDKLLHVLLDVAVQVSGADTGSVMFFERSKDYLSIRAAKGISDEIVKKTRVRLGTGISGLAAKERVPFLISKGREDDRIKGYLRRDDIKSSMVIPIKVRDMVAGVMNLGVLNDSAKDFNPDNLKLMNRLIDLAVVAFYD